jgi:hypothetical protein
MMNKNIVKVVSVLIGLAVLYFVRGGFGGGEAIKYNDKLINYQGKVITEMIKLSKIFQKKDPVEMNLGLKRLQDTIDNAIEKVEAIPGYEGNTDLKDALLDLLDFYRDISAEEYAEMINIIGRGNDITQSDIDYLQKMQDSITEREKELDEELARAQSEFAKKHNIEIRKNTLQDQIDKM